MDCHGPRCLAKKLGLNRIERSVVAETTCLDVLKHIVFGNRDGAFLFRAHTIVNEPARRPVGRRGVVKQVEIVHVLVLSRGS